MRKHTQTCSLAGFLNVFGDAWTLLIMREAYYGTTRFSDFQRHTGAAKNLLSERLLMLVEHGILEKVDIGTSGARYAYQKTAKGESLTPLLLAMTIWSNEHLYAEDDEPTLVQDCKTGKTVREFDLRFGAEVATPVDECQIIAGPSASDAARKRFSAMR